MKKIVPLKLAYGYALVYEGLRYRSLTNQERYEGYMRNDFRSRTIAEYLNVEVVRIEDLQSGEVAVSRSS